MDAYYEYLMASLPQLQFGMPAPLGMDRLLEICAASVPERDRQIIRDIVDPFLLERVIGQPTLDAWIAFETALRNELVRIRASRRKVDPAKYLRRDGTGDPALYHLALHAHRIPALLESERFLDAERWKKLDHLGLGHYFDLDALVVYALKLSILIRWDRIGKLDKEQQLQRLMVAA